MNNIITIPAQWDAPDNISAFTTTINGGVSDYPYTGLNLGDHVGDSLGYVKENRQRLQHHIGDDITLCWLKQTHSDIIIDCDAYQGLVEGDASVSTSSNKACVIMTADCLPLLLSSTSGNKVAALHCGWKGLYQHLISKTISHYFIGEHVHAWLGPAIGSNSYEVDTAFYQRFVSLSPQYKDAFSDQKNGHYMCDLYSIAISQLQDISTVVSIHGGGFDTLRDRRFYSYRERSQTGRIATVIYKK